MLHISYPVEKETSAFQIASDSITKKKIQCKETNPNKKVLMEYKKISLLHICMCG